jgi:hypothetical protein
MKGVVFNIFEDFIVEGWGEEAYEALLDACPLHTKEPFVGPGTYPDTDLIMLVTRACQRFGVEAPDALRLFGTFMFPELAGRFSTFVEGHTAKSFLMSVHDVIHVEVRKLFPDAVTPSFHYEDPGGDELVIHYSSKRQLCFLMEGLLDGVGEHFGVTIERTHDVCMHDGADACRFGLRFVS